MKKWIILIAAAAMLQAVVAEDTAPRIDGQQKDKLKALLGNLKTKGTATRKTRHEVSLPVASAGARGAEVRGAARFSVLWPEGANISPLTALSVNLESTAAADGELTDMQHQLTDFMEVFPEFKEEPLLKDLGIILATDMQ